MAKRGNHERDSERVEVKDELLDEEEFYASLEKDIEELDAEFAEEEAEPETVRLALRYDVILNTVGPVTGRKYQFRGAGAILNIDKEDADIMILKKRGKSCSGCTGVSAPSYYFVVLE
jgi:hypothetical protein